MLLSDFSLGGFSSMGAIFVTNPLEVVKTRLQLQGELAKKGSYKEPYRNVFTAFITIAKCEGLKGLQKGLIPAIYFQFILNSVRFGIFTGAVKRGWAHNENGDLLFYKTVFWGAVGGGAGAFLSSPFFMIKTQLQSRAAESIAVGYQHKHNGFLNAFKHIYTKNGIRGLWQGSWAVVPRTGIGSGVQMSTFEKAKKALSDRDIVQQKILNSFCASIISGCVTSIAITPPDVVTTRLYNQPLNSRGQGMIYTGWFDCIRQIYKTESIYGFYKGFWANYFRIAPHSTLVLVFFDQLVILREKFVNNNTSV